MMAGRLLSAVLGEVRDIDEVAFRTGRVLAKFYGELQIPAALSYIQSTKVGGRESEGLAQQEIAADFVESMQPQVTYFMGSGQTVAAIMAALGLPNTLLGVDVICHSAVLQEDVTSLDLLRWTTQGPCRIVVTVIGGQGHVFGRGNQQFSPEVIRAVGLPAIDVVATKTKLEGLQRPYVIVDTGDQDLDQTLSGVHRIRTGYNDAVLMRWGTRG
jgi:predicted polyphosphate/ATP-dependent NAD kinase